MTYREVQAKLKEYRNQGLTDVRLNASREVLEAELQRLELTACSVTSSSVISHQSSVSLLEQEPPHQLNCNGQLSIFWDNSDEPPDPDDFESLDEYEQAWRQWCNDYPELAEAIAQREKLINGYAMPLQPANAIAPGEVLEAAILVDVHVVRPEEDVKTFIAFLLDGFNTLGDLGIDFDSGIEQARSPPRE